MKVDETEITLALQLKGGRESAFREIYFSFYKAVSYFIGQYVSDPEAVKDLSQEVFRYIWEYRERIEPDKGFKSYLLTIARTKSLNYIRNTRYGKEYADKIHLSRRVANSEALSDEMLSRIQSKDLLRRVNLEIERLPEGQKQVLIMSRREYKTNKEIAELLNISIKTVEWRIMTALKKLRRNIDSF